ncbi:MAG: alanine racemase [Chloroflexi bacterium]|nr:alanine racemase [Chloroflexota bacterium]
MTSIYDLETPAVLIDLDRMERNIARMQADCDDAGVAFRPHVKTHKIPEIAHMQIDAGAVGLASQKVSEAQVFAEAGFDDILIPFNIVGPAKTARLVDLALYTRMTVSADSEWVIRGLSDAAAAEGIRLRVMVDLETEIHRTGANVELGVALAQMIDEDDHLTFAGLMVYPSNPTIRPVLQEVIGRLNGHGIGVEAVSGGGIGAAKHMRSVPELTEIRVGTYLFNDLTTLNKDLCSIDDCAMRIAATVVSRPSPGRAILDAGSKTLTPERLGTDAAPSYGLIVEYPDARIYKLNEEHGHVDVSACYPAPQVGEVVHIIPVHTCVVTNMHDQIYGIRGVQVDVIWNVAARGKVK